MHDRIFYQLAMGYFEALYWYYAKRTWIELFLVITQRSLVSGY